MNNDSFDLTRFIKAQADIYDNALAELKAGRKRSHWMWFIFPQLDGLAHSSTAKYYALQNKEEAQQYLNHAVLGKRLLECAAAVLTVEGRTILEIMGSPDNLKLNSSMTLFAQITNSNAVFTQVIDKYFEGKQDIKTIELLETFNKNANF